MSYGSFADSNNPITKLEQKYVRSYEDDDAIEENYDMQDVLDSFFRGNIDPIVQRLKSGEFTDDDLLAGDIADGNILSWAVEFNYHEVVSLLLEKVNYKLLPDHATIPINVAVTYNYVSIVEILIKKMDDIDLTKQQLLHKAVKNQANEILQLLLQKGAEVNEADKDGKTALYEAANCGNVLGVKILLKHGASINQRASNGKTPMHAAVCFDQDTNNAQQIIDLLSIDFADLDIKDNEGKNILDACTSDKLRDQILSEIEYRKDKPFHAMARCCNENNINRWLEHVDPEHFLFDGCKWVGIVKENDRRTNIKIVLNLKIFATPSEKESIKYRFFGIIRYAVGTVGTVVGTWMSDDTICITTKNDIFTGNLDKKKRLLKVVHEDLGDIAFKFPHWSCTRCDELIPLQDSLCLTCAPSPLNDDVTKEWIEEKCDRLEKWIESLEDNDVINDFDHNGRTAIACAAMYGSKKMLDLLYIYGKVSPENEDEKNPADYAIGRKLFCRGSLEEQSNVDTLKCLEIIQSDSNLQINKSLIPQMQVRGTKYERCNGDCQKTKEINLVELARDKKWAAIESILRESEPSESAINELDTSGKALVHYICESNKVCLFKLLCKKENFKLNIMTNDNKYPLYFAAKYKRLNMSRALLEAGAEPTILNAGWDIIFGRNHLDALESSNKVKGFLVGKADLKAKYPLYYLAQVENLTEAEKYKKYKKSAMHVAIEKQLPRQVLTNLVEEDFTIIDAKDTNGVTPLMLAVQMDLNNYVKFLLENDADVDAKGKLGRTALMLAALKGSSKKIVKSLLEKVADIDIEDDNHKTVLNLLDDELLKAKNKDYMKIKRIIIRTDEGRESSVEYQEKVKKSLNDLDVIDAFYGNGFSKAINCSPVLGRTFLNDCVMIDRYLVKFENLHIVYGAKVRESALYSVLNMKTDNEDLINQAKTECLEHVVIRRIMEIKWELFAQRKYIESLLIYILLLSSMSISSILFDKKIFDKTGLNEATLEKVIDQQKSTMDFCVIYGTIVMVFAATSYILVQGLRPRNLWRLARIFYDRSYDFNPKIKIPDLQIHKHTAKKYILFLTIALTSLISFLALEFINAFGLEQHFMLFNNLVLAASSFYFILTEYHELKAARWSYFKDILNWMQSAVYLLIFFLFVPMKLGLYLTGDISIQIGVGGIITIFLWILSLQFLEVVASTSYLLPLAAKLMGDVANSLIFLGVFQIADENFFGSLSQSFYSTYFVLFGQFPTESLSAFSDISSTGEHFLYLFAVILMMFHAAAVPIILMNLLMASMNKTVDGGLERARTEALSAYAKAILRLEISNYSKEENEKLTYFDKNEKLLNPIFTQSVRKASLNITPEQEKMIQDHLKTTHSRLKKVKWLNKQVVKEFGTIKKRLEHLTHFCDIDIKNTFKKELEITEKYQKALDFLLRILGNYRDQTVVLEKFQKRVRKVIVDMAKEFKDMWTLDFDTPEHKEGVLLYQLVHRTDLSEDCASVNNFISELFDAAINEAKIAQTKEPKTSEVVSLLDTIKKENDTKLQSIASNNNEMQVKLDNMEKKYCETLEKLESRDAKYSATLEKHESIYAKYSESLEKLDVLMTKLQTVKQSDYE
ncbi:hypothetical protein THRCLA_03879 [Thraustotheca clavata]|uniref:Ion transport domain-containing protein n=1 Tax=Thraustotheca clavata TaxID=74557 RepID=A0A1W0A0N3_9STRA|nr:hypothetical protein THRCLA_03879 [Thraustotheca clavata]